MKQFTCVIQIIKVYEIDVSGIDENDAMSRLYEMSSIDIEDRGIFRNAETDHAEVLCEAPN